MEAALLSALEAYHSDSEKPITWPQVLEEWMMRLALHGGKHHWGYKTPQDFMHMDKLTQIFPGVRFVYILRDPRKMMRSFKNLPRVKTDGNQDGESRQYHPAVYALYWKKAYEKVQAFIRQGKAPVKTVKFEDLVQDPAAVAADLADFLETQVAGEVVAKRSNASVKVGQPTELTQTEVFLCEKIAGQAMQSAGYELCAPKPRLFDLVDLLKTSVTFATYQLIRITKDKKARTSVRAFLKSLVK